MLPSLQIRYFLVSALLGILSGGLFEEFLHFGLFFVFLLSLICLKNKFIFILISVFLIANLYSFHALKWKQKATITPSSERAKIIGKTLNYPEEKSQKYRQHLQILSINNKPQNGRILIEYQQSPPIPPKHTIEFNGRIKPIPKIPDFNYTRYLQQFGITGISKPKTKIIIIQKPFYFWQKIGSKIRQHIQQKIESRLPQPHSTIALGMTIGSKKSLPKKESLNIKNSGLQHLIVVSGSNITLLIGLICLLFNRAGPTILVFSIFVGLTLFWLTVGPEPPVNRAFIFGLCGSLSFLVGRKTDSRNILLLAGLIMAILNPFLLTHSVSFWLSFLATFGIILVMPITFKIFEKMRLSPKINLIFSLTISAQISVMTLIIHQFGYFPSGGLVSNLLVEPIVPLIMAFTGFLGVLEPIPIFSEIVSFILFWLINMILIISQIFSQGAFFSLKSELIYFGYGLQIGLIIYGLFSQDYEKRFFQPFQSKLDLSLKATKIGSHDR